MKLLVLLPLLTTAFAASAQNPLPHMDLHLQSLDGHTKDLAGPPDVSSAVFPDLQRMWQAQGRRRARLAHRRPEAVLG